MSTPIETNTEELNEILQTVYNLPNRSSGGSAEPDMTIRTTEGFDFASYPTTYDYNCNHVTVDQNEFMATYEKLMAGNDVRVTLTGSMPMSTYGLETFATIQADRVIAYIDDYPEVPSIMVRFRVPCQYGHFSSSDNKIVLIRYLFRLVNGSVELTAYTCSDEE